jgi:hypothetical protein
MSGDITPEMADDRPLFIIGSVRSGTTLTRDLLRRVPNFISPEETHFFRWAEPFRTPHSLHPYRNNNLLKKHRNMDGVDEAAFEAILGSSRSKAELQRRYIAAYARAKDIKGPYRWFDKTPQNVYGVPLIAQQMPHARFLFLVRNPLNVVASMKLGRQVKIPDLYGACNYWLEAAGIMTTVVAAYPERVLQMRYEDLVADVPTSMAAILAHAGVDAPANMFRKRDAHPERNLWRTALGPDEAGQVRDQCASLANRYGYDLAGIISDALAAPHEIATNTP